MLGLVLETVHANDLWIQDRNFCTTFLSLEISGGRDFITRQHEGLPLK